MQGASSVAIVATFTALIVGSDFALAAFPNVKLLDTLVFVGAYIFGFRVGALIGVLSESIWSFVSPEGIAGGFALFLVVGEVLFAVAGWAAAKAWGRRFDVISPYSLFIGGALAICAFLWDLETNFAYALFAFWPRPTLYQFLGAAFGPLTLPFIINHEASDFVFGVFLAPTFILLIPRVLRRAT